MTTIVVDALPQISETELPPNETPSETPIAEIIADAAQTAVTEAANSERILIRLESLESIQMRILEKLDQLTPPIQVIPEMFELLTEELSGNIEEEMLEPELPIITEVEVPPLEMTDQKPHWTKRWGIL